MFAAGARSRVMLVAKRGVLHSCMFSTAVRSRFSLGGCAFASLVLLGGPARPLASASLLDMSGASLLDSKASFKTKVLGHGLPVALFHEAIARRGVATLSKAAYAVGAPGVLPSEDALRNFLNPETPAAAGQGQVPIVRRLTFVAQTLAVSQLRQQLRGPTRSDRISNQLRGVSASKSRLTAWQVCHREGHWSELSAATRS